jgi:hypothetical protein
MFGLLSRSRMNAGQDGFRDSCSKQFCDLQLPLRLPKPLKRSSYCLDHNASAKIPNQYAGRFNQVIAFGRCFGRVLPKLVGQLSSGRRKRRDRSARAEQEDVFSG